MKKPFYRDLAVVLTLTILSVVWLLVPTLNIYPINVVPYALLLLFLPGYSLMAFIKPSLYKLRVINIVYSLILSFLITISVALLSSFSPLKSLNIPMFTVLPALTILLALLAAIRRRNYFKTLISSKLEEEVGIKEKVVDFKQMQKNPPLDSDTIMIKTVPDQETVTEKPKQETVEIPQQETIMEKKVPDLQIRDDIPPEEPKKPDGGKKSGGKRFFSLDLLLVLLFTVLAAVFVLEPTLNQTVFRTGLGLLLILFLPGYALIAALFPKKDDLDGIERVGLSFGLSIAITPLIGLALNYTPYGIRLEPILISLSGITLLLTFAAYLRRRRTPVENRFWVDFGGFFRSVGSGFSKESRTGKVLSIVLVIAILLAVSSTAYVIVKPKPGETFTEFYILGPNGKASDYPTNLTSGENGTVIIGVVSHENAPTTYTLVTASNGTAMDIMTFTLQPNEKKEIPYTFTAGDPGLKKIEFLLFKLPDNSNVYRSLHLWVNITGGSSPETES